MKNKLITLGTVLISLTQTLCAFGQQINMNISDVGNPSESFIVSSIQPGATDKVFVFGAGANNEWGHFMATCAKVSLLTGDVEWAKSSDNTDSQFYGSATMPNGNLVAVGYGIKAPWTYADQGALVTVFSPSGTVVWSNLFIAPNNTRFRFHSVACDEDGNIYAMGKRRTSVISGNLSLSVLVKFDPLGNIIWSKEMSITEVTPGYGAGNGNIFLRNDSIIVLEPVHIDNNSNVGLSVYSKTTGDLLLCRLFGYGGNGNNEDLRDAAVSDEGIFFTYNTPSYVFVAKVSWSTMALAQDPVLLFMSSWSLRGGEIAVQGQNVYVLVEMFDGTVNRSFALKMDQNLSVDWFSQLRSSTSFVTTLTSLVLPGGDVVFVEYFNPPSTFDDYSCLTQLTPDGLTNGEYCITPSPFAFQQMGSWTQSALRYPSQQDLVLVAFQYTFSPQSMEVENCSTSNLPIELIFFQAKESGDLAVLEWETASELNTSHFNILRSQDGLVWGDIGSVDATGNSQHLQKYGFVDNDPLSGTSYYKLNSVDIDQTSEFSDVVFVRFDERNKDLVVYPNPAQVGEWFTVKGKFERAEAFDQSGRQVSVEQNGDRFNLKAGPGLYTLNLFDVNGVSKTVRVVTN